MNSNYRHVDAQSFIDLLEREGILEAHDPEQVVLILRQTQVNADSQPARMHRVPFPRYRASRRYLEFKDCVYDVFEGRVLPVGQALVGDDGCATVHPVYKFEKAMEEYNQLPEFYLGHVARLYTGADFVRVFTRFLRPLVTKQCSVLVTGPPNVGKTIALIPIVEVYRNVLGQISADDGKFSWASFGPHSIIIGSDVNPLVSRIFYDHAAFLNIVGGFEYTPPVKCAALELAFQPKVQLYTSNDAVPAPETWQPGYSDRLEHVKIAEDCPAYDRTGITHEEVRAMILGELGQIFYYLIKRPDELVGIIDAMRQDQPPPYEEAVPSQRQRPALCAAARLHDWPNGVCIYCHVG